MKYFIANHKNVLTKESIEQYIDSLSISSDNCKVIICPSNIYIPYFEKSDFDIGVQNVSYRQPASGEVSVEQIASMNIKYCIVGHSDNRINQFESNKIINNKICELLNVDITPILCVGENKEERSKTKTFSTISEEILLCLDGISPEKVEKIIIAYEPIWAISNGNEPSIIPSNNEIEEVIVKIKTLIKDKYNVDVVVLYGGSVNLNNIKTLNEIECLDGYLIGAASTKVETFNALIKTVL